MGEMLDAMLKFILDENILVLEWLKHLITSRLPAQPYFLSNCLKIQT
jgi:hypothetical protein